jgi:ferredoxin
MSKLIEEIRSVAMNTGADIVGFAPAERFDGGPEKTHPRYYMPKAKSVVVAAIGYPRAIGEVWGTYEDEGCTPTPYMWFGFAQLNWDLSRVALKIAKTLESHGHKGLPLPPAGSLMQYRYVQYFDEWNRYLGDFSHKHAALAAGLGTFGWSNLFLTPDFGARVRLISVITEAEFEAKDLIPSEELCKPELCGYACVNTCPIGALIKDEFQEFKMEGQLFQYGALDHLRCRWSLDGYTRGSGSRTHLEPPDRIKQTSLAEAAQKRHLMDRGLFAYTLIDFCGKCMHQCPSPEFEYVPGPIKHFKGRTGCYTVTSSTT